METHEFHEKLLHLLERQIEIMATLDADVQAAAAALTQLTTGYQQLQSENEALTAQVATLQAQVAAAPDIPAADQTALESATTAANEALNPTVPLVITTADITGAVGEALTGTEAISGGTAPYTVTANAPEGVSVDNAGNVTGSIGVAGTTTVTLSVTDSAPTPQSATASFTITVS